VGVRDHAREPVLQQPAVEVLANEGLIAQDLAAGCWQCDIRRIGSLELTDDVVQFLGGQLQKLPPGTRSVLELAACIGNCSTSARSRRSAASRSVRPPTRCDLPWKRA